MSANVSRNKELTAQQYRFLEAVLLGSTTKDAAEQAGITERTAIRWTQDEAFKTELRRLQAENLERVLRRLTAVSSQAVNVLLRNMKESAPPSVQVRAATVALDQMTRLRELHDIEARLAALEEALGQKGENR